VSERDTFLQRLQQDLRCMPASRHARLDSTFRSLRNKVGAHDSLGLEEALGDGLCGDGIHPVAAFPPENYARAIDPVAS
jgi:hypothetical protein